MHDLVVRGGTIVDGRGGAPFTGDVAIDGDTVTAVGSVEGRGRRELDAAGLLVTPGFVDVHTHYDAQATWDPLLTSSCWHGVTTVVMGNCGVGFAPVRPDRRRWFIEMMEAVEDIPAWVLGAALDWQWETFPEYVDALARRPRALDVATMLTHSALRVFVMDERGADPASIATADDLAAMARLATQGAAAGAIGFSTARSPQHRTGDGSPVPCFGAHADELAAVARGLRAAGRSFLEVATAFPDGDVDGEFARFAAIARDEGCHLSMPIALDPARPGEWQRVLRLLEAAATDGLDVSAQVATRPIGALFGLRGERHPFAASATFRSLAGLDAATRRAELGRPAVRAAILAETPPERLPDPARLFVLEPPLDYVPDASASLAARAARASRSPLELAYDVLAADPDGAPLYLPARNWQPEGDAAMAEMLTSPVAVPGLGDGGAHCTQICDMSAPTTLLTYWGRDRRAGPTLPVERLVQMHTADTARVVGLRDRGVLVAGRKADLNLIDWDALAVRPPRIVADLPAGGRRLVQRAGGYVATIVTGEVVFEHGEHTGALPGAVVR